MHLFQLLKIWMGTSKITSCAQNACFKGKRSQRKFEKPNVKFGLSLQNGTTSNEEIPTAKLFDVTPHKRVPFISSLDNIETRSAI